MFIRIPNASRPWQHVMDALFGYLKLAEKLYYDKKRKYIGSWNFGPNIKNNLKVLEVANTIDFITEDEDDAKEFYRITGKKPVHQFEQIDAIELLEVLT